MMQPVYDISDSDPDDSDYETSEGILREECAAAMKANRDFREWKDLQVENEKYFDKQDQAREKEKEWTRLEKNKRRMRGERT